MPDSIINQHSNTILQRVLAVFTEDKPVRSGFANFFPRVTSSTLDVSIQVKRNGAKIAVDVERFTEGNYTQNNKVAEKLYRPPFYKQNYSFSRDNIYMTTIALGILTNLQANQAVAQNALDQVRENRDMIERAILKQQMEVLQTGVVTLRNGDNINYRRKAASMVDLGAGNYWNQADVDPFAQITAGCTFLREQGSSAAVEANLVMRGPALTALLDNEKFKERANFRRVERLNVQMPQFDNVTGLALHGVISAGDWSVLLWTYNEYYTDENDDVAYYQDFNQAILMPTDFRGLTAFGGLYDMREINIGGVMTDAPVVVEAEFLLRAVSDKKTVSSELELTSAPLVIPYTVDRVYTMKVLADA